MIAAVRVFAGRDRRVRAVREPVGPCFHVLRVEVQAAVVDALRRDAAAVDQDRVLRLRIEANRIGREGGVAGI